jgi:hypothetical protein
MNLMFWKKPGADDEAGAETPAEAGLAARMGSWFAGLAGNFRKAPAFRADVEPGPDEAGDMEVHDHGEAPPDEMPDGAPARSKRLILAGAIGLLVLLLAGIGIAIWPDSEPPEQAGPSGEQSMPPHAQSEPPQEQPMPPREQPDTDHEVAAASGASGTEPAPPDPQAEIEALRKENAELQARIEALRKEQPQQRPRLTARGGAASSPAGGEMAVGSEDPKAAAMTLKEAIEAMNAASGDYKKKPAQ